METIKDRHDIVECLVKDPVSCQDLRESNLKYIPDVMVSTYWICEQKCVQKLEIFVHT